MGRNVPREELIARTKVLPREIPIALTPWPNMIAPKPQAKPHSEAMRMPRAGTSRRLSSGCDTVPAAITTGIRMHEMRMKRAQTFSQDHRPRYRMGSVNVPFISPETTASVMPSASAEEFGFTGFCHAAEKSVRACHVSNICCLPCLQAGPSLSHRCACWPAASPPLPVAWQAEGQEGQGAVPEGRGQRVSLDSSANGLCFREGKALQTGAGRFARSPRSIGASAAGQAERATNTLADILSETLPAIALRSPFLCARADPLARSGSTRRPRPFGPR